MATTILTLCVVTVTTNFAVNVTTLTTDIHYQKLVNIATKSSDRHYLKLVSIVAEHFTTIIFYCVKILYKDQVDT